MSNTALIIIDMQKAYFQDPVLDQQKPRLVDRCNELVRAAIDHNIPVWNIVTEHARDKSTWTLNMKDDDQGFLFAGSEQAELVQGLEIGKRTIVKTRDSAFHKTTLTEELTEMEVNTLIICGVSTQSCIFQTAADAYANDMRVVLAVKAIATNNSNFHEATLKLLENEYRQRLLGNQEILRFMAGTEF